MRFVCRSPAWRKPCVSRSRGGRPPDEAPEKQSCLRHASAWHLVQQAEKHRCRLPPLSSVCSWAIAQSRQMPELEPKWLRSTTPRPTSTTPSPYYIPEPMPVPSPAPIPLPVLVEVPLPIPIAVAVDVSAYVYVCLSVSLSVSTLMLPTPCSVSQLLLFGTQSISARFEGILIAIREELCIGIRICLLAY